MEAVCNKMAVSMVRDHMEAKTTLTGTEVATVVAEVVMDNRMGEGTAVSQTSVDLEAKGVVEGVVAVLGADPKAGKETGTLQFLLETLAMLIKPQLETSSDRQD